MFIILEKYSHSLIKITELKRYIKQIGEVVVYYRNVTMPNGEKGVGVAVKKNETDSTTD